MVRAALLATDPATFPLARASRGKGNAFVDIPDFLFGLRRVTVVARVWLRERHTVAPKYESSRARSPGQNPDFIRRFDPLLRIGGSVSGLAIASDSRMAPSETPSLRTPRCQPADRATSREAPATALG
jgi:hypothetical protein